MKQWKKIGLAGILLAFIVILVMGILRIKDPTGQILPKEVDSGTWVREWQLKQNLTEGQVFGTSWLSQDEDWLRAVSLDGETIFERRLSGQDGWSVSDRRLYVYNRATGKIECFSPTYDSLWAISFMKPIESVFTYNGLLAVGAKTGQSSEQLMILDPEAGQVLANLASPNGALILPNRGESDYYVHGIQMKDGYWRNGILHFDKAGNLLDELKVNEPVILATRPLEEEGLLLVAQRSLAIYRDEAMEKRYELDGVPQDFEVADGVIDCLLTKEKGGELIRLDTDLNLESDLTGLPKFTKMRAYQNIYYVWNEREWGTIDRESLVYTPGTQSEEEIFTIIPVNGALWMVHEYGIDIMYWKGDQ